MNSGSAQTPPCPVCASEDSEVFFEAQQQPVLIGLKCATKDIARSCRKGDLRLRFCAQCAFVWNELFDPELMGYDEQYENSLHFSKVFRDYTSEIVARLVERYRLSQGKILDIGCGKGDFLAELCERSRSCGFGFDPSYEGERVQSAASADISWHKDYFDPASFEERLDLVTSRYVLEHIPSPRDFVEALHENMQRCGSSYVYFEVPDVDLIINQHSLWDIIYEHCSYFSPESLANLYKLCGFKVLATTQGYQKQFVSIEAEATETEAKSGDVDSSLQVLPGMSDAIQNFSLIARETVSSWETRIEKWREAGQRVALWGAGAKTVSFLNMVGNSDLIEDVVDINPHKVDHFIPGTGHRVSSPSLLCQEPADLVIVMNPVYEQEIREQLQDMGQHPELVLLY